MERDVRCSFILSKAIAVTLCTASIAPFAAIAQDTTDVSTHGLEEVVVTAQRRESTVQDVSASISVVSADLIERIGSVNSESLQNLVPGLVVSRDIGLSTQIFIRGIGNNLLGIGSGNSVATYVDGVYIPNSVQVFQNFNDVARVEVLKGPQAVLYGRNATGGALLVASKRPSFTTGFEADAAYGNYDAYQIRASVTGPLVDDKVAGRLSIQQSDRDGYNKSLSNGRDQDYEEITSMRGELLFALTDALSIRVAADYTDMDTGDFKKGVNLDGWMYQLSSPDQYSPNPRGRYQQFDSRQPSIDKWARVSIDWKTSLGDVTSVTSYREFKVGPVFFDNDSIGIPMTILGNPFQISFNGNEITSDQLYHETFIATDSDKKVRAIAGFNYFDEDSTDFSNRYVGFALATNDRQLSAEAYSAYVDLSFDMGEHWTGIAGARYSSEKKKYSQTGLNPTTGAVLSFAENEDEWSQTTPRFGLEYRPGDGSLYYLTATKGFKSGGFNESNPLNAFDPEKIWAYEAGAKNEWGGRIRTSVAAYYYKYDDLQVQQIIIPSFARLIRNAASATIYGLDAEISAQVSDRLQVGASAAYLHSEYGDFEVCIDLYGPCTITGPDGPILNPASNLNVNGNQMANAPELTAFVFGDYRIDGLPFPGSITLHADASYRSDMYFSPYEVDIHKSDAFWLLGAEARYESEDERWFVSAYGRNLTDELYETWIANVARFLGPGDGAPRYVSWGAPRTYGLRVGVKF